MMKQEEQKSNIHVEEDFSERLDSLNLDLRLPKLIIRYQ